MKRIFYLLIGIFLTALSAHAQLANTKWKATLQLDQPLDVIFNFGADTLDVTNAEDHSDIEAMKYTAQDTVLSIEKLYGNSQCDTSGVGKYSFKVDGDTLSLKLISDYCTDRSDVIGDIKLEKTE
ncbi:MAG TPA: hypothetical protein VHB70_03035 [Parafilimonas sp.]|nr:hypothetical protein [Parafilimonas sp.]